MRNIITKISQIIATLADGLNGQKEDAMRINTAILAIMLMAVATLTGCDKSKSDSPVLKADVTIRQEAQNSADADGGGTDTDVDTFVPPETPADFGLALFRLAKGEGKNGADRIVRIPETGFRSPDSSGVVAFASTTDPAIVAQAKWEILKKSPADSNPDATFGCDPDSITFPNTGEVATAVCSMTLEDGTTDADADSDSDSDTDGGVDTDFFTKGSICPAAVDFYDNVQFPCTFEVNGEPVESDTEGRPENCSEHALWIAKLEVGTYNITATCGELRGDNDIEVVAHSVSYESIFVQEPLPEGVLCVLASTEGNWFSHDVPWRDYSFKVGRVVSSACVPYIGTADEARLDETTIVVGDSCDGLLVVGSAAPSDGGVDDGGTTSGWPGLLVMIDEVAVNALEAPNFDCNISVSEGTETIVVDTPVSHVDVL